jgi:hypothetical protein
MFGLLLKSLGALLAAALLAAAVFAVNLVWFRPFSLNLFYEKALITFVLEQPELLTSLGSPSSSATAATTPTSTMPPSPRSSAISRPSAATWPT